jgi:hypothetical protein
MAVAVVEVRMAARIKPAQRTLGAAGFGRSGLRTRRRLPAPKRPSSRDSRARVAPTALDDGYYEGIDAPPSLGPDFLAERHGPYAVRLREAGENRDALAAAIAHVVAVSEIEAGAICNSASRNESPLIVDGLDLLQAAKVSRYLLSLGAKGEVYDTRVESDRSGALVDVESLSDAEIVQRLRRDFARGSAEYRDYVARLIRNASESRA